MTANTAWVPSRQFNQLDGIILRKYYNWNLWMTESEGLHVCIFILYYVTAEVKPYLLTYINKRDACNLASRLGDPVLGILCYYHQFRKEYGI